MISSRLLSILLLIGPLSSLRAVENLPYPSGSSTYNTNNTISDSLPSWTNATSWGTGNTNTGWNYVGQVGGASDGSGVYLGNGWVITAGHVGALDFTLGTNTYATTGYFYTNFMLNINGTNQQADLNLFRVSTTSTSGNSLLPANDLTLNSIVPNTGSQLVMIGYGDAQTGRAKSWGINTVTVNNIAVPLGGYPYVSADFETAYGTNSFGTTNTGVLVVGDSGGGAFVNMGGSWRLAGINEAVGNNDSYFVDLSYYRTQIQTVISAVPEASTWALLGTGILFLALPLWRDRRKGSATKPWP